MDLFFIAIFFYIGSLTEGEKFRSDLHVLDESEAIQRLKEIIDDRRTSIGLVRNG